MIKSIWIDLLEFVGFDGVDGRGVLAFEDRRSPEDKTDFEGTELKYKYF